MNDLTNIPKNSAARLTEYEQRYEAKKAFRVRQQEDKESKLALEDFKRHYREEQDAIRRERANGNANVSYPPNVD